MKRKITISRCHRIEPVLRLTAHLTCTLYMNVLKKLFVVLLLVIVSLPLVNDLYLFILFSHHIKIWCMKKADFWMCENTQFFLSVVLVLISAPEKKQIFVIFGCVKKPNFLVWPLLWFGPWKKQIFVIYGCEKNHNFSVYLE